MPPGPSTGSRSLARRDPGAVVTGRVLERRGQPVPPGVVVYYRPKGLASPQCAGRPEAGVGRRRSTRTVPSSCATCARAVRGAVRALDPGPGEPGGNEGDRPRARGGERIVLDIVLFAKGSVARDGEPLPERRLALKVPVPGPRCGSVSVTESQSFGRR